MYNYFLSMTSGFHHKIKENCTLLGYYAARSGNLLTMFPDNLSVASTRVMNPEVKMGAIGCPETSVSNYHYMLHSDTEDDSSQLLLKSQLTPHKKHTLSGSKNSLNNLSS
jgi:hypothetical protein